MREKEREREEANASKIMIWKSDKEIKLKPAVHKIS